MNKECISVIFPTSTLLAAHVQEAQEPGDEGQVARVRQADVRGVELLEARLVQHTLEAPGQCLRSIFIDRPDFPESAGISSIRVPNHGRACGEFIHVRDVRALLCFA